LLVSENITNMLALQSMKPYQEIAIIECGEPLVAIPLEHFAVESPHPYQKLGAPYQERSPYYLRQGVLERLMRAQSQLQLRYPNWQIKIFDAYRPVEVQQFMVEYTFAEVVREQGLKLSELSQSQQQGIWEQVYQFWAVPSFNPATPPPHSTGAAIDVTLVDETGQAVNMGTEIDEISPASHPDYYANTPEPTKQTYHTRRQLLCDVMVSSGFSRHPTEWWHFSQGDQMWAWCNQGNSAHSVAACYGRVA
jgi:D-alanyl-D-alanine dipeptidase